MTKYVLNSGGLKNQPERAQKFWEEVFDGLGKNPKLLVCLFSMPRQEWEKRFENDREIGTAESTLDIHPIFELAFPETFAEQIKNNDVVLIRGGDDNLLMYWLRQFDIPKIWEDKVVASSSAGSDALAKHFWTCDWRKIMDGLGILPVKFLPHFESEYGIDDPRGPVDWQKGYEELKNYGDQNLPIHALREGDYVVIRK